ncbi:MULTISPECIES: hypothetical protein [Delftia]|nr:MULTISPECIES: hypothetical protein [Delftia]MBK0115339.1 hypothetical protein [Delftia sp. S65]MBK0119804.1 hypothetical protein [Delftia sp. S67]MBK0132008.1 hypothetical protein [Delftia sp. S66]MDH2234306.1 hypothetical protein [Delftia tsuruhatensis]
MKKHKALYQLGANLLMWLCMPVVIGGLSMARGGSPTSPFPKEEFLKLVEPSQLFMLLGAGLLFFLVLSIIRHKSKNEEDQKRAFYFAELGLDEMASALYSFGSILLVSVFLGATLWYILAAISCYGVGLYFKPSE